MRVSLPMMTRGTCPLLLEHPGDGLPHGEGRGGVHGIAVGLAPDTVGPEQPAHMLVLLSLSRGADAQGRQKRVGARTEVVDGLLQPLYSLAR